MSPVAASSAESRQSAGTRFWVLHLWLPLGVFFLLYLAFAVGGLDQVVSDRLFDPIGHRWIYLDSLWTRQIHHGVGRLPPILAVAAVLFILWRGGRDPLLRAFRRAALYFVAVMAAGTATVALGKATTNMDCPRILSRYGGSRPLVRLWEDRPNGLPRGRCFPGGHSSRVFSMLGLYFIVRERDRRWAMAALAAVLAAGGVYAFCQWARGAHFPSHDLTSAMVCWLWALGLYRGAFRGRLLEDAGAEAVAARPWAGRLRPAPAGAFRDRWLGLWFVLALAVLVAGLGDGSLIEPDEGRNAEVAREMAATSDFLLPRLNGVPYLDKPVAFFGLSALAMKALGPTVLAARLVPLLFGIATALLTGWLAARMFGPRAFWVAALAAFTAPLALVFTHVVILDSLLAFLVTLALGGFYLAVEARREARGRAALTWAAVAWTGIALGVLTKGPVALLLPLLVAAPYALWRRASRAVWHPVGLAPLALLVVPWVWAMERAVPGFLRYVVVTETWARVASDQLRRSEPWYFFAGIALVGFFPWWIFAARRLRPRRSGPTPAGSVLYLRLWLVLPLIFFSLSRSKMPQYILPLAPAVALAAAGWWVSERWTGIRTALAGWAVFGVALAAIGTGLVPLPTSMHAGLVGPVQRDALLGGALIAAVALVSWWIPPTRRRLQAAAVSLPLLLLPVTLSSTYAALGRLRSGRRLAAAVEPQLGPKTRLLGIRTYLPSLSFYLGRTYPVASASGDELRSNYVLDHYNELVGTRATLRPERAWQRAASRCNRPWIFLVRSRDGEVRRKLEASGAVELGDDGRTSAYRLDCRPGPEQVAAGPDQHQPPHEGGRLAPVASADRTGG